VDKEDRMGSESYGLTPLLTAIHFLIPSHSLLSSPGNAMNENPEETSEWVAWPSLTSPSLLSPPPALGSKGR